MWCVCGGVNIHTIVGIFLTKRQITRSIIRTSGFVTYVTSHSVSVEPLYRLHKKIQRKAERERQTIPYLLSLLPCRIPSVKPLHTNSYNAQNNTARNHLSYYRIVQGQIILQHSYAPGKIRKQKAGGFLTRTPFFTINAIHIYTPDILMTQMKTLLGGKVELKKRIRTSPLHFASC